MSKEKQIEEMAQDIENGLPDYEHNWRDCRAAAEAMFAKGYRKSEWISVDERLPEAEGKYLVYTVKGAIKFGEYYTLLQGVEPSFDYYVTHWMPLPEAPKMKNT